MFLDTKHCIKKQKKFNFYTNQPGEKKQTKPTKQNQTLQDIKLCWFE